MSPLELWEADLNTLSRVDKAGTLSDPERKKVQEFADRLDVVRPLENGHVRSSDHGPRLLAAKTSSSQKESSI